jgi:hypothetical protein
MDIKVVTPNGKPVEEVSVKSPDTLQASPDDLYQREVGKVLGVENESEFNKYQPDLKTLVEYAKSQTSERSSEGLKWIIRSLEIKLGTPPFAEDRVKFITRYAWLLNEEKRISDEKKKFERL